MNKQEYLDALKRALTGLPAETVAKTLAYYEQHWIDAQAAGRTDAEISKGLDEPRKIAMTLRANTHLHNFEQKKTPVNLMRMLVSSVGLAIFNLFMLIPAMVYGALLTAIYVCSLLFYLGGVVITASGLSGQNELVLNGPLREVAHEMGFVDSDDQVHGRILISENGIEFERERDDDSRRDEDGKPSKIIERSSLLAGGSVHISTDFDNGARSTQTFFGLGLVLAGIALCLVSLVITKYTVIGIRRYVAMNLALLRGR
ncbi:DUF1700 domain-containing protein [Oxalobacteraceae bacterium]|nr:DUF1700 domain-containing protein [Oxalobacteraceae bacterium]